MYLVQDVIRNGLFHEFSLFHQLRAAIGGSENGRPIGVTIYVYYVDNFEDCLGGYIYEMGGFSGTEKTHSFFNTLYVCGKNPTEG